MQDIRLVATFCKLTEINMCTMFRKKDTLYFFLKYSVYLYLGSSLPKIVKIGNVIKVYEK